MNKEIQEAIHEIATVRLHTNLGSITANNTEKRLFKALKILNEFQKEGSDPKDKKEKLIHELFIGKVADEIGIKKTAELVTEATRAFR